MRPFLFLLMVVFLSISCKKNYKENIKGEWKASRYVENDSIKEIDLSRIVLSIGSDGRYDYKGNLKQNESWMYSLEKQFLKLTPEGVSNSKYLKILFLNTDSLALKMEDKERLQRLEFRKKTSTKQ